MQLIVLDEDVPGSTRRKVLDVLDHHDVEVRVHDLDLLSSEFLHPELISVLNGMAGVAHIAAVPKPYARAARVRRRAGEDSVVHIGDHGVGGGRFTVIAGPCAVETEDQIASIARSVAAAGAQVLRGGAYKPRTSPYEFQGLGPAGVRHLAAAGRAVGLPVITEVMDPRDIDTMAPHVDALQIGARNMQNYSLLHAVGETDRPVLLKRGLAATVDDTLLAAEHVMAQGNEQVILCERGIRTFETSTRFTLDVGAVIVLKERSHLPVLVDPSHAAGKTRYVAPLARAAAAVGADGVMIEAHNHPETALCDGEQAFHTEQLAELTAALSQAATIAGGSLRSRTAAAAAPEGGPR